MDYKNEKEAIFTAAKPLPGIAKAHVMKVNENGNNARLWRTEIQFKEDSIIHPAVQKNGKAKSMPKPKFTSVCQRIEDICSGDEEDSAKEMVLQAWKSLGTAHEEKTIVGNWYAVIYTPPQKGKKDMLFIAKARRRFLEDVDGPVRSIEVKCLKHKVGSGNVLDELPDHLEEDIYDCPLEKVIAGPLLVTYQGASKFAVEDYENLVAHFHHVVKQDRVQWKQM